METKKELRTKHLQLRRELTDEECRTRSNEICQKLLHWEEYKRADVVYGYYPLGSEVSLLPLFADCLARGVRLALPKVNGDDMDFYQLHHIDEVSEGCFHVMEPTSHLLCNDMHALVLTPGVVFDRHGSRIGYGRGYYDKYFTRFPNLIRVGIAYDTQVEPYIETEPCDKRMNYLVTEHDFFQF